MMDFEIMHVVEPGKSRDSSSINVNLSSEFNRKKYLNGKHLESPNNNRSITSTSQHIPIIDLEHSINSIWTERTKLNPRLFNGTKFRIHNVTDSVTTIGQVEFYLGVSDYKEFIGTNWSPHSEYLQKQGMISYGNSQAFLSDALGVGASVVTSNKKLILLKRSHHCAEAPSMWDVPGGHAEPSQIIGEKRLEEIDVTSMSSQSVLHEIFDSITREVVDEVNIPGILLSQPLYMGTHRNLLSAGRPSLAFVIKCDLTSDEVQTLYKQGSQIEADETTNIMFLPIDTVAALTQDRNDIWESFAPSAKGNLTTFCIAHGLR
ncbi:nucleoside diphosphate-linked moiety X motif 22 [Biomphalaria glabrata]|uniref:Uridine diphosphate glucose pyrophosphatase NUDT22-like n=1 Tax=Biomphalaria glabrata TaxID=6526 RepID=A0A9U8EFH5_BIOGL|nr:uridine diphosphate glucose pyrophosphatase NUDT22-like [Biomphalaria glabrata]KAI8740661.1 nucleoside diphosphate-linked moiety X motif 22-like [Biomphalaria glabrata]